MSNQGSYSVAFLVENMQETLSLFLALPYNPLMRIFPLPFPVGNFLSVWPFQLQLTSLKANLSIMLASILENLFSLMASYMLPYLDALQAIISRSYSLMVLLQQMLPMWCILKHWLMYSKVCLIFSIIF